MSKNLVGILLAAGQSRRFGSNKLLHVLPESDKTIVSQASENLLQVLPNSIAVIRENDQAIQQLAKTGIRLVENPNASLGLSSSIVCGIQNTIEADAWVIALADMPYIPLSVYEHIVDGLQIGAAIVAPVYNNKRGHPIGFANRFGHKLLQLNGDMGAKMIIQEHLPELHTFESPSDAVLRDIDTPEDIH